MIYKFNNFLNKPLNKIILWIFLGFIIFLVGIIRPKADSFSYTDFTAQLYDNSNGSLSAVTTNLTNGSWRGIIPYMVANSSGAAWGISSGKPLLANHTYSFTIQIEGPYGGRIVLSTYNRIGVGTSLANARTSYQNNSYVTENYSNANGDNGVLQFAFTPSINGSYIVFPFGVSSTGSYQEYWLSNFIIEDLGASGVTETTINNSLNNQTNIINNSIQATENNITNSINSSEQNITNNFNEKIDDTFNSCSGSQTNLFSGISWVNGYIRNDGTVGSTATANTLSDYISVTSNTKYNITANTSFYNIAYALFDSNRNRLSSQDNYNTSKVTLNTGNASYIRVWFNYNNSTNTLNTINNYDVNFNDYICQSKLDVQTNAINDVNDTLNDDDTTGATSEASDFFSDFNSNTFGLTSIVTAPLNLIQSLTSQSCSPLHLPLPYLDNKYLDLPCMSSIYSQFFGNFFSLYQTITFGIIAYWVCVRIFNQVKDFKNPEHDEIEVLDL